MPHDLDPRIAEPGGSRIGDERDRLPREEAGDELGRPRLFIVLVEAHHPGRDFVMREQRPRAAGVFGRDERHLPEDSERAQGDVLQVADRGGHQVQNAGARRRHISTIAEGLAIGEDGARGESRARAPVQRAGTWGI